MAEIDEMFQSVFDTVAGLEQGPGKKLVGVSHLLARGHGPIISHGCRHDFLSRYHCFYWLLVARKVLLLAKSLVARKVLSLLVTGC